ncbi:MAG: glycosyltransferase family 4 protein [Heyndrickxia sp.]
MYKKQIRGKDNLNVGFIFSGGFSNWIGGRNYFNSLFSAIDSYEIKIYIYVFCGEKDLLGFDKAIKRIKIIKTSALDRWSIFWILGEITKRLVGHNIPLNLVLKKNKIDVVSHTMSKQALSIKQIAWIPDLQVLYHPELFGFSESKVRLDGYRSLLNRSDRVIVSSQAASDDCFAVSPKNHSKCRVLSFSVKQIDKTSVSSCDARQKYKITRRYMYIPNQFWVHKNHMLVFESMKELVKEFPELLIICSGSLNDSRNKAYISELYSSLERDAIKSNVQLLGVIPYEDVMSLMYYSECVINPSYFEGWSTSVEEAKAMGIPLLVSDIPVHREQCEQDNVSVKYFNPHCTESFLSAARAMLNADSKSINRAERLMQASEHYKLKVQEFAEKYSAIVNEVVFDA